MCFLFHIYFFKLRFTPCKGEQPPQGMEFQDLAYSIQEICLERSYSQKRYLLILDLKPLRSYIRGKHSIGRDFQSSCARKEPADIDIL